MAEFSEFVPLKEKQKTKTSSVSSVILRCSEMLPIMSSEHYQTSEKIINNEPKTDAKMYVLGCFLFE